MGTRLVNWRLSYVLMFLMVFGCATVNYDQQADQQLSAVLQEVDTQLLDWASQAATDPSKPAYDSKFYDKLETDLTGVEIRMEAIPFDGTQKLVAIFQSLHQQVDAMRDLHKEQGKLSKPYLIAKRNYFDAQIAVLVTFELSLKASQASGSNGSTESTATKSKPVTN